MSKNRFVTFGVLLVGIFGLAACETVPYPERVAAFEGKIRSDFVGKSSDNLVLAYGPPSSTYPLTDGREMVQYSQEREYTVGGGTYTDFYTETIGYRTHTRPDGSTKKVAITRQVPILRTDPIRTIHEKCIKRFVVAKNNIVEDFKWEGNSCFK